MLMQFEEQKDQVAVERVLRVVFLDVERSSPVSSNRKVLVHILLRLHSCLSVMLTNFQLTALWFVILRHWKN